MLYDRIVLTIIAALLAVLALRPAFVPQPVRAQAEYSPLYIEPRTTTLRKPDGSTQVQGKVVIDLRTGDIYGFPTLSSLPYPVDGTSSKPPVSEPMYLGRFDFSKIRSRQ
jgi:hypothetical protein